MTRRRYLLCYDIREPARLRQVHQLARAYGYPLQYSVFVCDLTKSERIHVEQALTDVMHLLVDSVVFVDLGQTNLRGAECFNFLGFRPFPLPTTGPTIV